MAIGPQEANGAIESRHPERLEQAQRIVDDLERHIDEKIRNGRFSVEDDDWDHTVIRVTLFANDGDWIAVDRLSTQPQFRVFRALEERYMIAGWESARVDFQSREYADRSAILLSRRNKPLT